MNRPTTKEVSALGYLGLAMVLIGLIIGFAVAIEYDPAAADFRETAEDARGVVVSVDGPMGLDVVVEVITYDGPADIEVRADDHWVGRTGVGEVQTAAWTPGDLTSGRLDSDVPIAPRRAGDAVAPLVIIVIGPAMITFAPEVLYLGFGPSEVGAV